ncbi:MAG: hypothetical protein DCO99_12680, partial [Synechococcus sp. XM-24]
MMFDKPFDFNRIVQLLITIAAVIGVYLLLDRLSTVLIPFFLAWLVSYLLEPLVKMAQRLVKKRIPAVIITLVAIGGAFTGFLALFIPLLLDELSTLKRLMSAQLSNLDWPAWIPKDTAGA